MIFAIIIIALVAVLLLAYAFLIATRKKYRKETLELVGRNTAHRGLHTDGVPENSLAAFARAAEHGYGFELDVRLSKDGVLYVFHDETLGRLCGVEGRFSETTSDEIDRLRLAETDEKIPRFSEVLAQNGGAVPMIIEVKPRGDAVGACRKMCEELEGYDGKYCVESFNPVVLRWLKKNRPEIIRGQLACHCMKDPEIKSLFLRIFMTNLFVNSLGRPDFIAYDYHSPRPMAAKLLRALRAVVFTAWTIRSREEYAGTLEFYDGTIFERFEPSEK